MVASRHRQGEGVGEGGVRLEFDRSDSMEKNVCMNLKFCKLDLFE